MSVAYTVAVKKRLLTGDGPVTLDVNVSVAEGAFVALSGASGVGKTTLLRMLAGLTAPDEGSISAGGESWYDSARGIKLSPQRRRVGVVFQDYALFPNMTVRENLAFALDDQRERAIVDELLELVHLTALAARKPDTLSGGQQQRVALARALVRRPRLLLLDEPLSALDPETRLRLQDELLRLHKHFKITTVLVSHDTAEVFKLADRVWVMEQGRIVRDGAPGEVFAERRISGKFRFTGEVLAIEPNDVVYALSVLVGNQIVTVIASRDEARDLAVGDRVMLVSKAFNPMVLKIRNQ